MMRSTAADPSSPDARRSLDDDGFAVLGGVFTANECDELLTGIAASPFAHGAGSRQLLDLPVVAGVACRLRRVPRIADLMPLNAVAVQCTLFSKDSPSNWSVGPHQDLSIPVAACEDSPGWSGWSRKEAIWFAQAPVAVLERMVAIRLQLDPADAESGPLRVLAGSHRVGRWSSSTLSGVDAAQLAPCIVDHGGVLVMKPLLVHASRRATSDTPRRVLHFLYAAPELPNGMRWARAVH
jgi:hypothetical protein